MLAGSVILGRLGRHQEQDGHHDRRRHPWAGVLGGERPAAPSTAFWLHGAQALYGGCPAPSSNSLSSWPFLQEKVEPEYLGRVLGLSNAIMTLLAPPTGLVATRPLAQAGRGLPCGFRRAGAL